MGARSTQKRRCRRRRFGYRHVNAREEQPAALPGTGYGTGATDGAPAGHQSGRRATSATASPLNQSGVRSHRVVQTGSASSARPWSHVRDTRSVGSQRRSHRTGLLRWASAPSQKPQQLCAAPNSVLSGTLFRAAEEVGGVLRGTSEGLCAAAERQLTGTPEPVLRRRRVAVETTVPSKRRGRAAPVGWARSSGLSGHDVAGNAPFLPWINHGNATRACCCSQPVARSSTARRRGMFEFVALVAER